MAVDGVRMAKVLIVRKVGKNMDRELRGVRKFHASHHPQAAEQEWSGREKYNLFWE